ncbi:MAG: asparagine synthase-related protein [Acidobacteriota bacterium]
MSGLFGIVHRDGSPVPWQHLDLMAAALAELGVDGQRHVCDRGAGLGCLWWDDVAGPGRDASLHVDAASGLVTIAEGWLADSDDLARDLRFEQPPPIAELVAAAWLRSEERFFAGLAGELTVVLWTPRDRRLQLIASPACNPALYVWESAQRVIIASRTRAIHAVPGIERRIDLGHLARSAVPGFGRLRRRTTFFAGVTRLRPGTFRVFGPDDSPPQQRWWQVDPEREFEGTADEIVQALEDRLTKVLRARMAGGAPVACLLSGGLDSSTVMTFAHVVADPMQLFAVSAVHAGRSGPDDDERRYIGALRDHLGLDVVEATADGRGPFDDLTLLPRVLEAGSTTSRHYLYTAFAGIARRRGARIILDGVGGETTISDRGTEAVLEGLLAGRPGFAARLVLASARAQGLTPYRAARSLIAGPLWRERIRRRPRFDVVRSLIGSPFRREFLRRHGVDADELSRTINQATIVGDHRRALVRDLEHVHAGGHFYVGADAVTMSCPLLDRRIIEICLAAPLAVKLRGGYPRALARHMLANRVPDLIRLRTSKQAFSPDYADRFNRQVPMVERELAAIPNGDPVRDIVDVPKLQRMARHRMTDPDGAGPADFDATHNLPAGVYLIEFLRQYLD